MTKETKINVTIDGKNHELTGIKFNIGVDDFEYPITVVNMTPHQLNIITDEILVDSWVRPSGPDEIIKSQNVIIPPSGIVTRLLEKETNSKRWLGQAISLRHIGFTCIDGLPEKHVNVIYVVSRIVAQHLGDRNDIFCPGDLIRDGQGNIIGCKGLAHF